MEFKVIDKKFYWSMNDENHCIVDPTKIMEYFEKSKDARYIFDDILNYVFDTNKETINYLFVKKNSRTRDALATTVFFKKKEIVRAYPINNSYFCEVNEKTCKKIDLKNNNVVAFITNLTNDSKVEVYLSETNFSRYNCKVDRIIPVIVFNLPEYAEDYIYEDFYKAFKRLFLKSKVKEPGFFTTDKPIVNAKKRKQILCKWKCISEEYYDKMYK